MIANPFTAHRKLPRPLRVWALAPAVIIFVGITGLLLTLPPGPLCDEGMVLFMEGGCDYGESNIFFFSKLGLLVGINAAFAIAWRRGVKEVAGFTPHLVVLVGLTSTFLSDPTCETYYSHPNGSIGQMTAEAIGFALLGLALLRRLIDRSWGRLAAVLFGWNATHVAIFYLGLLFTNHWTWLHTGWVAGVMAALAYGVV